MPRSARILVANFPHHIVQRGYNRQAEICPPLISDKSVTTGKTGGLKLWTAQSGMLKKQLTTIRVTDHGHRIFTRSQPAA